LLYFACRIFSIGEVYIGGENTLIFLVSAIGDSALAIADRNCNLNVIVNDADQTDKLGFRIDHQISATFRLRRGCERVIYGQTLNLETSL
jgi:hypothetical protein